MRCILLNPGPVSLSESVRKAAVDKDLCPAEPEFAELLEQVRQGVLAVYDCHTEKWATLLLAGSAATALEALVTSLLPRDARLLVVENGYYGERISRMAEIHGIDHQTVRHAWTQTIDFEQVEQALSVGLFTHLAAVQHEATTGRLNDIRRLAKLCERHGTDLLLDATCSFGAEDIPLDSPALAGCATSASRCLHGIPGLGVIVARREALARAVEPPRSLSLHLPSWQHQRAPQGADSAPPVNCLLALRQALVELRAQGGWQARQARYRELAAQVRSGLAAQGIEPLLAPEQSSCAMTVFQVPEGSGYAEIHDGLKRWGFVVDAGQDAPQADTFRISTMGDITRYDMERLQAAVETVFKR